MKRNRNLVRTSLILGLFLMALVHVACNDNDIDEANGVDTDIYLLKTDKAGHQQRSKT